jgi:hypothetical protein
LLGHPLGPTADKVQEVLEDMLGVNEGYLGRGTWDVARGT